MPDKDENALHKTHGNGTLETYICRAHLPLQKIISRENVYYMRHFFGCGQRLPPPHRHRHLVDNVEITLHVTKLRVKLLCDPPLESFGNAAT